MHSDLRDRFLRDGFVLVRRLLAEPEISNYVDRLRTHAAARTRWTQPDGVNRNPDFWPLIFNTRLLAAVREIFGPDVCYLPHNDLHVGFSSFSWHRDSVTRQADAGADWNEAAEPYQLARVGIYLQRFAESRFKLGLIRGSHRPNTQLTASERRRLRYRTSAVASVLSSLSGLDAVGARADWIATEPGDCVIFDPRILHTGSKIHGEKYSIFLAYGVPNSHFLNHWHYYQHLRPDLGYASIDPTLAERLQAAGLLAAPPPAGLRVDDAWIPSPTFTYVARKFK